MSRTQAIIDDLRGLSNEMDECVRELEAGQGPILWAKIHEWSKSLQDAANKLGDD